MSGAGEVAWTSAREGIVVPVRARPRGRRDAVVAVRGGALCVEVTAAPEEGEANDAIRRVLADCFGVARAQIELSAGGASRQKRFRVAGLDVATARSRLEKVLR